jgi:hypothetical protein
MMKARPYSRGIVSSLAGMVCSGDDLHFAVSAIASLQHQV